MNFLPEYQVVRPDSIVRLSVGQVVVEVVIVPKESPIDKILSISCDSTVVPSEVFSGEARYSGKIHYRVVYIDIVGNNHSIEHSVDFFDKLTHDRITQATKVIFDSQPLDTDTISVTQNELRLATVVEVRLDGIFRQEIKHLVKGGEGIYSHNNNVEYSQIVYDSVDSFGISDNFVDSKAIRLLGSESSVYVKKCTTGIDATTIEGSLMVNIVFETEGGLLRSAIHTIAFVQEITTPGATMDSQAMSFADIKSLTLGECDDNGRISIEASISCRIVVVNTQQFEPVVDAFSVAHDLLSTFERVELQRIVQRTSVEDRVEGSVILQDSLPLVDNILAIMGNKVGITASRAEEGTMTIEGVAASNIVYFNADLNSKNSVKVELPFSITISNSQVNSKHSIVARGNIVNLVTRVRRGSEIEVKFDILFEVFVSQNVEALIISDLQLGEMRNAPSSALSIHIAKPSDTLWDIARVLHATPEDIIAQNSSLVFPLVGGERVVTYRQLYQHAGEAQQ